MLIYIILYSFLALAIVVEKDNVKISTKKKVILFYVLVFTCFRGLRWNTGTDWVQYFEVFQDAEWNNITSYYRGLGNMEYGYMFINVLIKSIINNYTAFLLITNFFILLSYAKFSITNSKYPIYVFVLLMFSTQFFPVRIGIAVAFIIWGLSKFSERNKLKVIIYSIIAASIHSSAIIFIPVYLISLYKRLPTLLAVASSVVALVLIQLDIVGIVLSNFDFIYGILGEHNSTKFEHYLDYSESNVAMNPLSILNPILFIFTLYLFGNTIKKIEKEVKDDSTNYAFVYNIYFVFVIMGILFSSENMLNLKRLQNYFMFAFPILFASFIAYNKIKYEGKRIIYTFIFVLYLIFRCNTLFFSGYPYEHFPYISVFDKNQYRYRPN